MQITLKRFALLSDCRPAQAGSSHVTGLDVASDAPISQIIEPFGRPLNRVPLVPGNGRRIEPDQRLTYTLREGDVLAIRAPMADG
jgi:molybdopterin synthase sulfur carrier subunit